MLLGCTKAPQQANGVAQRATRGLPGRERKRIEQARRVLLLANPVEFRPPAELDVPSLVVWSATVEPKGDVGSIGVVPRERRHREVVDRGAVQDRDGLGRPAHAHSELVIGGFEFLGCRAWYANRRGVEYFAVEHEMRVMPKMAQPMGDTAGGLVAGRIRD
jgi:hypothetical protein